MSLPGLTRDRRPEHLREGGACPPRYEIRILGAEGQEHVSEETYTTRDEAREEIRRLRRSPDWQCCRFFTRPT